MRSWTFAGLAAEAARFRESARVQDYRSRRTPIATWPRDVAFLFQRVSQTEVETSVHGALLGVNLP